MCQILVVDEEDPSFDLEKFSMSVVGCHNGFSAIIFFEFLFLFWTHESGLWSVEAIVFVSLRWF